MGKEQRNIFSKFARFLKGHSPIPLTLPQETKEMNERYGMRRITSHGKK